MKKSQGRYVKCEQTLVERLKGQNPHQRLEVGKEDNTHIRNKLIKVDLMFVVPHILATDVLFESNWMYNILFSCKVFNS
jgi:hypothetical protein